MVKKHLTLLSLKNVHTYVYSNYVGDDQICDSNSLQFIRTFCKWVGRYDK